LLRCIGNQSIPVLFQDPEQVAPDVGLHVSVAGRPAESRGPVAPNAQPAADGRRGEARVRLAVPQVLAALDGDHRMGDEPAVEI
jgi:hypothetical protein